MKTKGTADAIRGNVCSPVRSTATIDSAFTATRELVALLEAQRVECIDPQWSVAQHTRKP